MPRTTRPRILLVDGIQRLAQYRELQASFEAEWILPPERLPVDEEARPVDLALVSQETIARTSLDLCRLVERGVPTLCLLDGIFEWRFIWENAEPAGAEPPRPRYQPVLSHKVACIGRSQARLLESWGNPGKCEVVGLPRLDPLLGRRPRARAPGEPARLLVMTARTPAYSAAQRERVERSLLDLKAWLEAHEGRPAFQPVWRLTFDLSAKLGVRNELSDDSGRELARVLESVDALVTTPSTSQLEGMLQGIPVCVLDYHNCPAYVPAAWTITAPQHRDQMLPELASPPPAKLLHQAALLHDALECRTPAAPRLARLMEEMMRLARECREAGRPLELPRRILRDEQEGHAAAESFDLATLYPDQAHFSARDRDALQAELGHLRFQRRQDAREIERLRRRLAMRDPATLLRAVVPLKLRMAMAAGWRRLLRS